MKRFLLGLLIVIVIGGAGHSFAADRRTSPSVEPSGPQTKANPALPDWPSYRKAATAAVASAVAKWQGQALLKDVRVDGVKASGGSVSGPDLQPLIERAMVGAGVPAAAARGFATPVSAGWSLWASSLRASGLSWYPAFACFAGPQAPPTPNVPMPLSALGGNVQALSAPALKTSLRQSLGIRADDPQAVTAINAFADDIAARFQRYRATVMVTNVVGTGPVPAYAPPHGPKCGPVVAGSAAMKAGGFAGAWPAN